MFSLQKTPNKFGAQKFRHQPLAKASGMSNLEHSCLAGRSEAEPPKEDGAPAQEKDGKPHRPVPKQRFRAFRFVFAQVIGSVVQDEDADVNDGDEQEGY